MANSLSLHAGGLGAGFSRGVRGQASSEAAVCARTAEPVGVFPRVVAAVVAGLACLDLTGWIFHITLLTSVFPHYSTMKPNTAVCLGLLAMACWQRTTPAATGRKGWHGAVADTASCLTLALSVTTLFEYGFHAREGIDGLFLKLPVLVAGMPPGRMAPGTGWCLTLTALAMLLMDRLPRVSVSLFLAVGAVVLSALTGFAFNAGPLFGVPWLSSVAVHTATGLLLLVLGGLAARPQREPVHSLLAQTYREGRTRWLLLGVTVLPLLLALPLLQLMRRHLADPGFTLAMLVVLLTAIQTLILWRDSVALGLAEKRRAQAEYALKQNEKLAVVGRLSASIAHEINNPLESVGTLVYLIQSAGSLEEASKYAEMAQSELLRVTQITSQTLKSVREPSTMYCEPVEIADSALRLLKGKLVASGVTVTRRFEDRLGEVRCRDGELRQVFINLISNALEATERGGRLVVKIRASRRWAAAKGCERERGVRIVFADSGTGMTREVQGKIFEPFFTTKEETGNGLGLWVARDLIEKHGGSLRVWSSTRKGATGTVFTVFLPVLNEAGPVS